MKPRRIEPYWEMFPRFLGAMFSFDGLLQLVAIGLFIYVVPLLPVIGKVLAFFAYVSYVFRVISHAAAGQEKLPEPEDFLGWESVFPVIFRFILASAIVWVPAVSYAVFVVGPTAFALMDPTAFLDPVLALLVLFGVAYFPAALIVAAVAESALAVVNPMITVRLIFRIPGQYAVTILVWLALTALGLGMEFAVRLLVPIPIVGGILQEIVGLLGPVAVAFVFGRLVYQNGHHFGVYRIGELVEPEWPEAKPAGTLKDHTHAARGRAHGTSIEVPGWESEVGADPMLSAQLPVDPPAGPSWGPPGNVAPFSAPADGAELSSGSISLDLESALVGVVTPGAEPAVSALPEEPGLGGPRPPTKPGADSGADLTIRAPEGGAAWDDDEGADTELDLFSPGRASSGDLPGVPGSVGDAPAAFGPAAGPNAAGGFFSTAIASPQADLRSSPAAAATKDLEGAVVPGAEVARAVAVSRQPKVHDAWSGGALLDPEPESPSPSVAGDEHPVRAALCAGDAASALRRFADQPPADGELDAREWLRLSGMLERAGQASEALRAARKALAGDPYGPFAPRAMFVMGRLFQERLGRPAKAQGVFESLIRHFPQDDFSQRAREALRRLTPT